MVDGQRSVAPGGISQPNNLSRGGLDVVEKDTQVPTLRLGKFGQTTPR
jgi:hypothetical protein